MFKTYWLKVRHLININISLYKQNHQKLKPNNRKKTNEKHIYNERKKQQNESDENIWPYNYITVNVYHFITYWLKIRHLLNFVINLYKQPHPKAQSKQAK